MPCSSRAARVERTQPLLGTLVHIACCGLTAKPAHRKMTTAFAAIADVHRLMSFHELGSDVMRLNQMAAAGPVRIDPQTITVLKTALDLAAASAGAFDITVAARLVKSGWLPRPPASPTPDPTASWRDIELLPRSHVRFRRPLWIDLGGIAKGFAVDCAIERVVADSSVRWVVNAGGDLRVAGTGTERVLLRTDRTDDNRLAVIELENASLASSSGRDHVASADRRAAGPHLNGRTRRSVGANAFVSVVTRDCVLADGLTKVVLALRGDAARLLRGYGAMAFLQDSRGAWQQLGRTN